MNPIYARCLSLACLSDGNQGDLGWLYNLIRAVGMLDSAESTDANPVRHVLNRLQALGISAHTLNSTRTLLNDAVTRFDLGVTK